MKVFVEIFLIYFSLHNNNRKLPCSKHEKIKNSSHLRSQKCILVVDRCDVDFNPKVLHANITVVNDGNHNGLISFTSETHAIMTSMKVYIRLCLPLTQSDSFFRREVIRTVCGVSKLLKGIYGNYLSKAIMEKLADLVDFELRFPAKKIRSSLKFLIEISFLHSEKLQIRERLCIGRLYPAHEYKVPPETTIFWKS